MAQKTFAGGTRSYRLVEGACASRGIMAYRVCWTLNLLAFLTLATPASARTLPHLVCDAAAEQAAHETGVPVSVMKSITRTETGRSRDGQLQPWPWTVNMEGAGHWFDTRQAAQRYVTENLGRGARSFDVGCFQINYRWHGHAFASTDAMFDPLGNARYAARFLSDLFAEIGDWSKAAGAYHSRTPEFAQRYRTRFDRIHSRLSSGTEDPQPRQLQRALRVNSYPLLQADQPATALGSLVPIASGDRPDLIQFDGDNDP